MAEQPERYLGPSMDRRYTGTDADVTYNIKRCIHAEYCVIRLAPVFNRGRRPWILADGATVEQLGEIIALCPSGALHIERKDGVTEPIPAENVTRLWHNGPLEVRGNLTLEGTQVRLEGETRATLCRCGGSANKPFCDNTHRDNGFEAADNAAPRITLELAQGDALTVTVEAKGPLHLEGPLNILDADGRVLYSGSDVTLCRCGGSSQKPFCDGTHTRIGFEAE